MALAILLGCPRGTARFALRESDRRSKDRAGLRLFQEAELGDFAFSRLTSQVGRAEPEDTVPNLREETPCAMILERPPPRALDAFTNALRQRLGK